VQLTRALLVVATLATNAHADRVVAITPLSTLGAEDKSTESRKLLGQIEQAFAALPATTVVTAQMVSAAIDKAKKPQLKQCEGDSACLTELGKLVGASLVVTGEVGGLGDSRVVYLKATDVGAARELRSTTLAVGAQQGGDSAAGAAVRLLDPDRYRGNVKFNFDVQGATVLVNGTKVQLPATKEPALPVGPHAVTVTHPQYPNFVKVVAIAYGRTNGPPEPPRVVGRTNDVVLFEPATDPDAPPESSALGLTIFTSEKPEGAQYPDLALAIVLANGDRQPVAPLFLSDTASIKPETNPDVRRDWVPLQVYAAPMRDPSRVDLVALAVAFKTSRFAGRGIDGPSPAAVWVAQGRGGTAFDAPSAELEIGQFNVVDRQVLVQARTAIGDIDNPKDGTNEVVAILKPPTQSSYVLRVSRLGADGPSVDLSGKTIQRDAPMEIVDVDGDGHADVVALLDVGTKRRVSVFFNDASGNFGAPVEVPLPEGEEAQGFALLTTTGARPFGKEPAKRELAIVTAKRIVLAAPSADRASFTVKDIVTEALARLHGIPVRTRAGID